MFNVKDNKTIDMFDRFAHLGPKRRSLLDNTWAKLFRDEILPNLPVHLLKKHYDPDKGRPTNELFGMMGAMILQQMHDLTDEQTVEQFCFNIQWHFALNITSASDAAAYVCPRSIWAMRHIMTEHNLYSELFSSISDHLTRVFKVDTTLQRLDSVHLFSNMRHLGRIRLFAATITKFLKNLKRHHKPLFAGLQDELSERYLSKKAESAFSMVKPSDASRTLEQMSQDLFALVELFRTHDEVSKMTSFTLLARLLAEQCVVTQDEETKIRSVAVKPNREVPSDSLQNPSDPDATYDGHKGQGYQTQVAETYCTEQTGKKQLNLITHIAVEQAHTSDAHAVIPYLDDTEERDLAPSQLLADSLYGSDSNTAAAQKRGVDLIAPVMGGRPAADEITLADFALTEKNVVASCPAGHAPEGTKRNNERHVAVFALELCNNCPRRTACPVKTGKRGHALRYNTKSARLAQRRAQERSPAFLEKYRFRSGIEATMSEFDRRTGVKHLRVRGLKAVKFSVFLKATGLNILRAAAFLAKTKKNPRNQKDSKNRGSWHPGLTVITQCLVALLRQLMIFFQPNFHYCVPAVSCSCPTVTQKLSRWS